MAAVGSDFLEEVSEGNDADAADADRDDTASDAGDVEMDDDVVELDENSSPAADDTSKKTATNNVKVTFHGSEKPKSAARTAVKKRRHDGWFYVGILNATSCVVTSYNLSNASADADLDDPANKHALEVGFLIIQF